MIHTVFIIICTVIFTLVLGVVAILASFFSKTGNVPHVIARSWAKSILFVSRVRVKTIGTSNLDPEKSFIYMANHQSNFDIPVLLGRLPVQFRWLAKAELFKIPIFGWGMKVSGYISIDRSNRESAFKSLEKAVETIQNGTSVMIFPEGTRSKDGQLKAFKKGGFVIAADSGVPIVPVVIHHTWEIMPKGDFLIKPRNVLLEIKEPVETNGYSRQTKDQLMDKIKNSIADSLRDRQGKNKDV